MRRQYWTRDKGMKKNRRLHQSFSGSHYLHSIFHTSKLLRVPLTQVLTGVPSYGVGTRLLFEYELALFWGAMTVRPIDTSRLSRSYANRCYTCFFEETWNIGLVVSDSQLNLDSMFLRKNTLHNTSTPLIPIMTPRIYQLPVICQFQLQSVGCDCRVWFAATRNILLIKHLRVFNFQIALLEGFRVLTTQIAWKMGNTSSSLLWNLIGFNKRRISIS